MLLANRVLNLQEAFGESLVYDRHSAVEIFRAKVAPAKVPRAALLPTSAECPASLRIRAGPASARES
jgi:hypothetical protein